MLGLMRLSVPARLAISGAALVTLALAAPADAGRGAALIKYLPDDASFVIVGDVARSRSSATFKKMFLFARDQDAWLDAMATAVAVDKLADTVMFSGNGNQHFIAVVEGRVDKLLAEAKKQSTKSDVHAGLTYWTTPDGEVALVDKKLVLTTSGDMPAVIDRAKNKKAKGPAAVRTILAATAPGTAVFGGTLFDASARANMKTELGSEPEWVAFSLGMAARLSMDVRLKCASDEAATKVAKAINDKLGDSGRGLAEGMIGKDFSDSISIHEDATFARVSATMTNEELDRVLTVVRMKM